MKITNIIIEAIKAMGDNMGKDISSSIDYESLKADEEYQDRVVGSMGIINRGLLRAYQLGGIAAKFIELTDENYSGGRIDTTKVDYFGKAVGVYASNQLIASQAMGEYIIAENATSMVYQPRPQIDYDDMDKEIERCGIPPDVANALALYCKYELYQEDKAELAKEALAAYDAIVAKQPVNQGNEYAANALNRGIVRAYQINGIAARTHDLAGSDKIDTRDIPHYGKLVGVYNSDGIAIHYRLMGEYIMADNASNIVYTPLPQITEGESIDSIKQYLSPELTSALPLYLKYEQYQHSDMAIAKEAISSFDNIVAKQALVNPTAHVQAHVEAVYNMGE